MNSNYTQAIKLASSILTVTKRLKSVLKTLAEIWSLVLKFLGNISDISHKNYISTPVRYSISLFMNQSDASRYLVRVSRIYRIDHSAWVKFKAQDLIRHLLCKSVGIFSECWTSVITLAQNTGSFYGWPSRAWLARKWNGTLCSSRHSFFTRLTMKLSL